MSGAAADVVVRDARPDERDAIAALTLRVYEEYATIMAPGAWAGLRDAVREALAADAPADRIVAERARRVVGSVMLFPPAVDAYGALAASAPWPELRLLAVDPVERGRGTGQRLVEECIRRARASGATALGLHTSRSMAAAMRMYRRMGFVRAPEWDFQPPGAELVEGYRLPLRQERTAPAAERPADPRA